MAHKSGVGSLGRLKMVPKSGVEMVWESQKMTHEKGLRASWFPKVWWEGLGNTKNEA